MELNFSASNKSSSEDTKQTLFSVKTGDLKLRLNNPKNIFYAEDVCAFEILPDYEKLIGIIRADFDDGNFGTRGKKLVPLAVDIATKDTIIGGSYQDNMPVKNLFPYQVKIYITYETEE